MSAFYGKEYLIHDLKRRNNYNRQATGIQDQIKFPLPVMLINILYDVNHFLFYRAGLICDKIVIERVYLTYKMN